MSLKSASELMTQVAARREALKQKQAAEGSTPADPNNTGTTTIPVDGDANDPKKTGAPNSNTLPASGGPTDGKILTTTNPSPSGSGHVPSTTDGNAIDESGTSKLKEAAMATSATFAGKWSELLTQAKQANASAPAAPAAGAAPAASAPAAPSHQDNGAALKKADDLFASVGAMVMANEEGQRLVTDLVTKQAGINQAQQMIHEAAVAADVYAKQAAYIHANEQHQMKVAAEQAAQFEALSPAERDVVTKLASFQRADTPLFTDPSDAFYWLKGASAAMAAMQGMPGAEGGMPPGAEGGMPPEGGGEMGPMPGGDGTPTPEDAMEILQALVQQGIITPEQAEQLMQQLSQEFQGGAPGGEGGPPPEGGGAPGGAPPSQTPPSEEEKAASALLAAVGA